jgi:DnaJ-class molecular chaperone
VTRAYDILTDKDKRARYDRGELDEDGNPRAPFGYGGGGPTRPGSGPGGGFGRNPAPDFGGGEEIDLSDLFDGLFSGGAGQRRGGPGGFGGFGTRRPPPPPQKGADTAYRLPISFEDAAALNEQRVTLAGGKTISIKLPAGVEEGTKIRLAGQGPARARPATATRSSPSRSSRTASSSATATISGSICPSRSTRRCSAPRSRCRRSTGR